MFDYFREYFDIKAFALCLALVAIGLLSVYSATFDAHAGAIFQKQTNWAVVGLVVLIACALFPFKLLQRVAVPVYALTLGALFSVLIIGKTISGSKSWFGLFDGSFGIQPSEFAKVATVLALASFLSKTTVSVSATKHLLGTLALVFLPMLFILAQPDLGTAVIFFVMLVPILYWAGASNFVLAAIFAPILVAGGALFGTTVFLVAIVASGFMLYLAHENRFAAGAVFGITLALGLSVQTVYDNLAPYQQKRIATFLNPESDPLGAGYNVIQSKVAIGSGGLLGKGYLQGTQTQLNFIPEQWTDFIFCVPGEEFGFAGASTVIILFALLLFHGIKTASLSKNKFGSVGAIGIVGVFGAHIFINIGMSLGLLPVIGIPLPFLSYGGSALVANMAMVGLLMNFYANRKEH
ncbi:MAG: rod shape-determining protein RodA [Bacteroidota bacterium]